MVRVPDAESDCSCRGEAEVRILDFKTTWSEFQMLSQTASAEAKPRYVYSILKPTGQNSRSPVRLLLSEAKPSYVYSILKPHGQSFVPLKQVLPNTSYFIISSPPSNVPKQLCEKNI